MRTPHSKSCRRGGEQWRWVSDVALTSSSERPSFLLQRFATIDEVAAFVTFVASPISSAINGAALRAEGGLVRSIF
jgi:NAD(P)-dependent dehydrogenase (short-subunit alcohol dehydrogenase family)